MHPEVAVARAPVKQGLRRLCLPVPDGAVGQDVAVGTQRADCVPGSTAAPAQNFTFGLPQPDPTDPVCLPAFPHLGRARSMRHAL